MPYLFVFAAGLLIGQKLVAIKKAIVPFTEAAAAKFDAVYSETARQVGTKVEDFEDRMAEKRFHSRAKR